MIDALTLKRMLEANFSSFTWTHSKNVEQCVVCTNVFAQAKLRQQNPNTISLALQHNLETWLQNHELSQQFSAVVVGAYVNIVLQEESLQKILLRELTVPEKNSTKHVWFEYVSPNVAKPIHAGHLRNIVIGESLVRILKVQYAQVTTDNHLGDWGVQFGVLLWAYKQLVSKGELTVEVNSVVQALIPEPLHSATIDFLVALYVYGSKEVKDHVELEKEVRREFLLLEQGNEENRQLWKEIVQSSAKEQQEIFNTLDLTPHTLTLPESFYEAEVKQLYEWMEHNSFWKTEGNARFIDFESESLGRLYLVSSTGYSTYGLRDVAARIVWARDYQADSMITITDHTQSHHFEQFFQVCQQLSQDGNFQNTYGKEIGDRIQLSHLTHLKYGFLSLKDGKMSTRKGNFLTAKDIVDEVTAFAKNSLLQKKPDLDDTSAAEKAKILAIAAIKWSDLNKDYIHDVVLDIPAIMSFEGNTGVYQLYTFARLSSILSKNETKEVEINSALLNEDEKSILKILYQSPLVLSEIIENYKPHVLCNHLYNLCTAINSWYAKYSIQQETDLVRKHTMLELVKLSRDEIKRLLDLLAISVTDEI